MSTLLDVDPAHMHRESIGFAEDFFCQKSNSNLAEAKKRDSCQLHQLLKSVASYFGFFSGELSCHLSSRSTVQTLCSRRG